MDFSWTSHQADLKRTALAFASEKLGRNVASGDRDNSFSRESWNLCAQFGVQGLLAPKEYGGTAMNLFDALAVLEGIGYGCRDNGLLCSLNAHMWGCMVAIERYGNTDLKSKYLPDMCGGGMIGAHAMSEPDAGSDVFGMTTKAERRGGQYVLNGSKAFVTNAPIADVFVVYARTSPGTGMNGITCFAVEKDTAGLSVGKPAVKMGLRTSPMADVTFEDCPAPLSGVIGNIGSGAVAFTDSMEWERTFVMAFSVGAMDWQLDACIRHGNMRMVGGRRIGDYQAVSSMISGMKMRLESGRMLLYKAVWLKQNGKSAFVESAAAKVALSEAYIRNSRDALQLHGAYGYMTEAGLERELRDAIASAIYSGTNEVLLDSIGKLVKPSIQ